jgi:hypothetical protein
MREGVGVGTGTGVCWIPLCPLTATPGVPFVNPAWPPTAAVGWRGVWSEMVTVFHGARVGMVFFLVVALRYWQSTVKPPVTSPQQASTMPMYR